MADKRFFRRNGAFKLGHIASECECALQDESKKNEYIEDVAPLSVARNNEISFLQNPKYVEQFKTTKAKACIVSKENAKFAPEGLLLLISEDPYYSYSLVTKLFYGMAGNFFEISDNAYIDQTAEIGKNTVISAGAFIGSGVIIGDNCYIGPNANITHSIIGNNVIIHSGASIGQDGFGFAFHKGRHHKVMQIGRVIIGNDVEIGANSTIDRGASGDTVISEGTKIDNLVQIGHNVKIGKHCIITAQVGISGSTEIGDYSVFGGQSGIAGHLKIGKQVQVAAQSGVTKNIEDGAIIGGTPSVPLRQYHKQAVILDKLANKKSDKLES